MKKAIITKVIIGVLYLMVFAIIEFAEIGIAQVMNYQYHGMPFLDWFTYYYQTYNWALPLTIIVLIASAIFIAEYAYESFFMSSEK